MEIERQMAAGRATLVVRGRLDAAWSGALAEALQQVVREGCREARVDLAGVLFLSSAGIRVLLAQWRELRKVEGRMAITAASPEVERTLRLAGLQALLALEGTEAAPVASTTADKPKPAASPWEGEGLAGEVEELAGGAVGGKWRGRLVGPVGRMDAPPNLATLGAGPWETFALPPGGGRLALGLGAFGSSEAGCAPMGELLAAGGGAVCLPADGDNQPDYLLTQGDLAPEARLAQGLVAEGNFTWQGRFESAARGPGEAATVGGLVTAMLQAADAPQIAFTAVVDVAALVGACLRRAPGTAGADKAYDFPSIRDWLTFTAEPAYANTAAWLVGVASQGAGGALEAFTRPLQPGGAARAHVHSAVFPYQPARHGRLELGETVAGLFDGGRVLGVLHLLNDARTGGGAGESRFYRGVCWFGALEV